MVNGPKVFVPFGRTMIYKWIGNDFVLFATAYDILDCAAPAMPAGCPADLNTDTVVDDSDFVQFATAYDNFLCP